MPVAPAAPFDPVVANPGRLRILTTLARENDLEFVRLRSATRLTDGNLSAHTARLASAGYVAVQKSFRDGKPLTRIRLTPSGHGALLAHARELQTLLDPTLPELPTDPTDSTDSPDRPPLTALTSAPSPSSHPDWID